MVSNAAGELCSKSMPEHDSACGPGISPCNKEGLKLSKSPSTGDSVPKGVSVVLVGEQVLIAITAAAASGY